MTMNRPMQLSAEVRVAAEIIDQIRAAIGEDDADFIEIVENECDVLERLRKMLRVARLAEADAKGTADVIAELHERKARLAEKSAKARRIVQWALEELGMTKLDCADMSVSLRASAPGVEIIDMSQLPERYVRVKIEPDKSAIREALKDGEIVPGAALKNGGNALTIRSR
jgi:type II secretory pathway component PulL